jgi:hypothetical protein
MTRPSSSLQNLGASMKSPPRWNSDQRANLVLIPCRTAALDWPTVKAILTHLQVKPRIDGRTLEIAGKDCGKPSIGTAQCTLRFRQLHDKIENS